MNTTMHTIFVITACYATSIKLRSKDPQPHVSLATILEELFYLEDLYGFKKEVGTIIFLYASLYTQKYVMILVRIDIKDNNIPLLLL